MSNDNKPKIILVNENNNNIFLHSRLKTYRLKDLIIIAKIAIIPENINLKIKCDKYDEVFNQNKFNKMKYLKEIKLIENYNSDESFEFINKKKNLYDFFIQQGRKYWSKQTKTNIEKYYKKECFNLGLNCQDFLNKNHLLDYLFKNPINDYLYGENNLYFISNKSNSNMENGLKISPIKNMSTYEYFIKMLNSSYKEDILGELVSYMKNNVAIVIDNINILKETNDKLIIYKLLIFILKDGLNEIYNNA